MNERRIQMLKDIHENKKIRVEELAYKYHVSQVTIRSDLKLLESHGLIKRIHGGASILSDERIDSCKNTNFQNELRIAEYAAQMIGPGETIILESGSITALLTRVLAETQDVTVVTNSYCIAAFVRDFPRIKIILVGGDCQPDSQVSVGPLARHALQSFYVDKLFIEPDGFSEGEGFTCNNILRAEIVSAMSKRARNTYILTVSDKFALRGVARQLPLSNVKMVITDDGITEASCKLIIGSKIDLITVSRHN